MMQSLLSKAPLRTALERRQFKHNAVSQSQTPKLFTRCYTLTYIVSSQLIASYAVAKSQSEVEVGTKQPIAILTLTICPWFLFFSSFSGRQMQTLCRMALSALSATVPTICLDLFNRITNMSVLANRQDLNIQFGN